MMNNNSDNGTQNNWNGNNTNTGNTTSGRTKNWLTTLILCWFLGFFGVHRMYTGKVATGILMLYGTIVSACILYMDLLAGLVAFTIVGGIVVNDFLRIATKTFKDCYGNYIVEDKI